MFSDAYLESTRNVSPDEVARFLDEFRLLHAPQAQSKLISMRVPQPLLSSFKAKCELQGARYQTKIKEIMLDWLSAQD